MRWRVGVIPLVLIILIMVVPARGVYTEWKKAYNVRIYNPYGDLRDHQVLVTVNSRTLIDNGLMRPDCGDLRFSDLEGNPLPYWVESGCGEFGTRVWVRIPSLTHGWNKVLMYTGNPIASSESDKIATMDRAISYGGSGNDEFFAIATDGEYVYMAGYTLSKGFGGYDGLIVKFDEELNPVEAKVYGGLRDDSFYGAYSDGTYVYAVGYTYSEGAGGYDAIIVKFDRDLNVVAKKVMGDWSHDWFYEITGDGRHLYAVGYTMSLTLRSYDAFIVEMDEDLNVLATRALVGPGYEGFHYVTTDGEDVYAVGVTTSGFGMYDGLVAKFDKDLNLLASKVYGGLNFDFFFGATVKDNRLYVAGYTMSAGSGKNDSLIVEFDGDLNVLKQKAYGGGENDGIATLSFMSGYLYAVGFTESEGSGGKDILLLKVDGDLDLMAAKRYGGTSDEWMSEVAGLNGYVYLAGFTETMGSGGKDAMAVRLYGRLNHISITPALSFSNSSLTYQDISLSLTDSRLILSTPSFSMMDSTLSSKDAGLSLERSFLRKVPDISGRQGPSLTKEEVRRKERIEAPDPVRFRCTTSFSGFPKSHYFVTALSDYKFNEDILSLLRGYILNVNWSSGIYKGPFLYVGGPDKIPFHWRNYGVRFLKRDGIYRALEYMGRLYEASYGHLDYAVVLVDCSSGDVRVAGITRYGTRAGLIWAANYVRDLGQSGLFLIKWIDNNGNKLVESFEITVARP